MINELRRLIDDDSIKIEVLLSFPAAISPPHPEAMRVITEFAKSHDPGVPVVLPLVRGFTDCHFFREKGIPCLGFMPRRTPPSSEGLVHGVDERIHLEALTSAFAPCMRLCVGSRLSSLCGASWRALTRRFAAASSRGRGGKMNYWICTFRTLDETQNEDPS